MREVIVYLGAPTTRLRRLKRERRITVEEASFSDDNSYVAGATLADGWFPAPKDVDRCYVIRGRITAEL